MRLSVILIFLTLIIINACNSSETDSSDEIIQEVPFTSVKVTDDFWYPKIKTNHEVTIPASVQKLYTDGRIKNFKIAGGLEEGYYHTNQPFNGPIFKVLEGTAYTIQTFPQDTISQWMDTIIYYVSQAQEEDGYLYPARTIMGDSVFKRSGKERWSRLEEGSHELFNMGHMMEAAVAHHQATGKEEFLKIAIKAADMINRTFGYGKLEKYSGHQEIEIALVRLYKETGDERYLDLAKFFLDVRGPDGRPYNQAHKKVTEQSTAKGHAVMATFMYTAMGDVAALTKDKSYIEASEKIWEDVVHHKLFITGGIGSDPATEGFEDPYILPNLNTYCETCASIGNVFWNHRMFQHKKDARYYDILERTLYNALLSGVSLDGDEFFYPNMLESHGEHERSPWFNVACCPTSMCRFIPSFPGYIYAKSNKEVFINLFVSNESEINFKGQNLKISQNTNYPWDGKVKITVSPEQENKFDILIRIPGWAREEVVPGDLYTFIDGEESEISARINGKKIPVDIKDGYLILQRKWKTNDIIELDLPMPVRLIEANEKIVFNRDKVAIQKGPIVFCAEWPDNPDNKVINLFLDTDEKLHSEFRENLLNGINIIHAKGYSTSKTPTGDTLVSELKDITLIPYHVWANRGSGEMRVWLPVTKSATIPSPAPTVAARSKVSASVNSDRLFSLNDQVHPENMINREIPVLVFRSAASTENWVQYEFSERQEINSMKIYWDDSERFIVPENLMVVYKSNSKWSEPKKINTSANNEKITEITTDSFTADAVKLIFMTEKNQRTGILEWIIN